MDQLKMEIIKHKPNLKNKIQQIGDNNMKFDCINILHNCIAIDFDFNKRKGFKFEKLSDFVCEAACKEIENYIK